MIECIKKLKFEKHYNDNAAIKAAVDNLESVYNLEVNACAVDKIVYCKIDGKYVDCYYENGHFERRRVSLNCVSGLMVNALKINRSELVSCKNIKSTKKLKGGIFELSLHTPAIIVSASRRMTKMISI